MVDPGYERLSIRKQCKLLDLNRSTLYYEPVKVSEEVLEIMHRIDEIFTDSPFFGSRRIQECLRRDGWTVSGINL